MVLLDIEADGDAAGYDLTQHRRRRRTRNAHVQHEDADGVEDDVHNRADALGDHRVDSLARGGQQALKHHLAEDAEGQAADDQQVLLAVFHHGLFGGLHGKEGVRAEDGEQQEDHIAAQRQKHAVARHAVGPVGILRAQRTGHQRIHAHRSTRGKADHQVLRREGQIHRVEGLQADPADEHAVHDVVQRLHQHRYDDGQRHRDHQLAHGHHAHLVFRNSVVLHVSLLRQVFSVK